MLDGILIRSVNHVEVEMRTSTIVLTVTWFLFAAQALGQSPELVEAAKKEGGKVIIYGSLETPVVEAVIQAFRKKTGARCAILARFGDERHEPFDERIPCRQSHL